jgi:hypothetical protein
MFQFADNELIDAIVKDDIDRCLIVAPSTNIFITKTIFYLYEFVQFRNNMSVPHSFFFCFLKNFEPFYF